MDQNRLVQVADLPCRLQALTPEFANFWIGIIDRAEPLAQAITSKRPCDYAPWTTALETVAAREDDWPSMGHVADPYPTSNFMAFARDAAKPGWPNDHAHLVSYSLRFLEADVMLFNSGYVKKNLLVRLRQSHLENSHIDGIDALIRRVVIDGTGLEEFREFCRLASHVMSNDLRAWLADQAKGVLIRIDEYYAQPYWERFDVLDEDKIKKLQPHFWKGHQYLFAADPPHSLVKIDDVPEDNRVKLNAWRMLMHVKRTET